MAKAKKKLPRGAAPSPEQMFELEQSVLALRAALESVDRRSHVGLADPAYEVAIRDAKKGSRLIRQQLQEMEVQGWPSKAQDAVQRLRDFIADFSPERVARPQIGATGFLGTFVNVVHRERILIAPPEVENQPRAIAQVEAARLAGVSARQIRRWQDQGDLTRLPGGKVDEGELRAKQPLLKKRASRRTGHKSGHSAQKRT